MQVSANWNQALKIENVDRKHYKTTLKCGGKQKTYNKETPFFGGETENVDHIEDANQVVHACELLMFLWTILLVYDCVWQSA